MGAAFLLVLAVPALRRFFELDPPSFAVSVWAVVVAVAAALALEGGWRVTGWHADRSGGEYTPPG